MFVFLFSPTWRRAHGWPKNIGDLYALKFIYSMEKSPTWEANLFSVSQEISRIFGTLRFITAFTSARDLSLSRTSPTQSMPPHPTSWRCSLILYAIYASVFQAVSSPLIKSAVGTTSLVLCQILNLVQLHLYTSKPNAILSLVAIITNICRRGTMILVGNMNIDKRSRFKLVSLSELDTFKSEIIILISKK
jgi:hypothetical protein